MLVEMCPTLADHAAPLRAAALPACATSSATATRCRPARSLGRLPRRRRAAARRVERRRARRASPPPTTPPSSSPPAAPPRRRASCTRTPACCTRPTTSPSASGLTADDRTYGYLPLFFNGGLVGVALATLSRGGAVLLQEVFDAGETLRLLERHRCTTIFAWPHQAEALIRHPRFDRTRLHIRKGPGANTKWAAGAPAARPPGRRHLRHDARPGRWRPRRASTTRRRPRRGTRPADAGPRGAHRRPRDATPPLPRESEGEIVVSGPSLMRDVLQRAAAGVLRRRGLLPHRRLRPARRARPAALRRPASRTSSRPPASTSPRPRSKRR